MKAPLNIAVVGSGYFGRFHARHYAAHPDCRLVAVVDADLERARAVAAEFGGMAYAAGDALPDGIDAASVAVATVAHRAVAEALLARGIAVLVEKPIAATLADADALVAAAEAAGAVLQVGHIERFSACFAAVAGQSRGRPRFLQARRMTEPKKRATDVDVVLDLMIHDIDLAMAIADAPVVAVDAVGEAYINDTLDVCQAHLTFRNGVVADLTASRIAESGERTLRIHWDDGFTVADLQNHVVVEAGRAAPGAGAEPDWRIARRTIDRVDGLRAEIDEFVAAVRGERRPRVCGRTGRDVLAVALSIGAAASGRQPKIHLDRSA